MSAPDIFASARGPIEPRPFPIADLLEAAHETSPWRLALLVGCGGGAMTHALEHGLSWRQADNWAIKLGKHPCEVWGVRWWTAIEPWDEEDET